MKSFFLGTYYFWIVTRILFCIVLFVSLVGIFQEAELRQLELILNLIVVVYWIMLVLIILRQLSGAPRMRSISSVVGVISMLIGIVLLLLPFMIKVISLFAIVLFSLWMLALGLFDLLGIQRPSPIEEEL